MRSVLLVLCMLLIVGCFPKAMPSWVGKHRDEAIRNWGLPRSENPLSTGGTTLVYTDYKLLKTRYDSGIAECRMVFETNEQNIIVSAIDHGCRCTSCIAPPLEPKLKDVRGD